MFMGKVVGNSFAKYVFPMTVNFSVKFSESRCSDCQQMLPVKTQVYLESSISALNIATVLSDNI